MSISNVFSPISARALFFLEIKSPFFERGAYKKKKKKKKISEEKNLYQKNYTQ